MRVCPSVRPKPPTQPARRAALHRLAGWAALPLLAACAREGVRGRPVPAGAAVLALGDSLTQGTGAGPGESYPDELARLTGWRVHNAGVAGDTSAQALARLPELLQAQAPALVLVSIGGNDLLRRLSEDDLRANLARICDAVLATPAQLMLIAVPKPSVGAAALGSLTDHPLYGEIAERRRIVLQRQGWAEVLGQADLRADTVHPNARGYARFAASLVATCRAAGFLA